MKKTTGIKLLSYIASVFFAAACAAPEPNNPTLSADIYENIEFAMPHVAEPSIPDYSVNLTDFGAVGDGQTLNTKAFADAIDAVTAKGGGKVIVPSGIWLTGPVILKSNLEIYTEQGATIIFSTDKDLYPVIETSFEGLDTWRCLSPIYGKNLENVALTGKGIWDGSGDAWRFVKRSKLSDSQWKTWVRSGGVISENGDEWYPSESYKTAHQTANMNIPTGLTTQAEFEAIRDFLRPVMVSIQNSNQVLIDGPTFQNSPAWCIHPLMVENLTVRNITVRNPWYSQNGDGIDIESCKNVLLHNASFDVGDDAICIKSGKDADGRRRNVPCENIVIKNCVVYHGHGGVTVGSEMSSGVRNMHVSNCTFIGTDVGLRFKSTRGRGGVVENIFMSHVYMIDIPTQAISFDLYYSGKSVAETLEGPNGQTITSAAIAVSEETPQFKNIKMHHITVKGAEQAIFLQGLPEMNLENIEITNMTLEADNGISATDVNNLKMSNLSLNIKNKPAFTLYNSGNIVLENFDAGSDYQKIITINGAKSQNIKIKSDKPDIKRMIVIGSDVKTESVTF